MIKTKQLTFDFGEFDEERIMDTVKEEFKELINKFPLVFRFARGDEMYPYKTITIAYMHENLHENNDEPFEEVLERIEIKDDLIFLFQTFEGKKAISLIKKKAHNLAIRIDGAITNYENSIGR